MIGIKCVCFFHSSLYHDSVFAVQNETSYVVVNWKLLLHKDIDSIAQRNGMHPTLDLMTTNMNEKKSRHF